MLISYTNTPLTAAPPPAALAAAEAHPASILCSDSDAGAPILAARLRQRPEPQQLQRLQQLQHGKLLLLADFEH